MEPSWCIASTSIGEDAQDKREAEQRFRLIARVAHVLDGSNKFHVWRMDWDQTAIRLYVDDELLNEVDLTKTINGDREGKNPFHQPHYILLNLAIGGTNGGDPSQTKPPLLFEVDYVRVYEHK